MRLLVVEDEAKTANFLAKGLGESGFAVDVALNGLDGRYFIEQQEYDLIILDVMLPGLNGWQLLQLIRQRGATPVLFLTAKDAIEDRVRGLELGADDYLVKPFAFSAPTCVYRPRSAAVWEKQPPETRQAWLVFDNQSLSGLLPGLLTGNLNFWGAPLTNTRRLVWFSIPTKVSSG